MRFDVLHLYTRVKYCRRDDGRDNFFSSIKRRTLIVRRYMRLVERIARICALRATSWIRIERALIHTCVDFDTRERCTGHIPRGIISSLTSKTNKRQLLSKGTLVPFSASPRRITIFSLPSTLLRSRTARRPSLIVFTGEDSCLIAPERALCSLLGCETISTLLRLSPAAALSPLNSPGSIFKVSNELRMIHGFAGLVC